MCSSDLVGAAEVCERLHAAGWEIEFLDGDELSEPYVATGRFAHLLAARTACAAAGVDPRVLVVHEAYLVA